MSTEDDRKPLITVEPAGAVSRCHPAFSLLLAVHQDQVMTQILSEESTISLWLRVEAELATAQAACGVIPALDAEAIVRATESLVIDPATLWEATRTVGYPILPMVKILSAGLSSSAAGRVHYGATTQDIMDTALAMQLVQACDRLIELVTYLGDGLADLVVANREVTTAARTHGQQAVPTTLGAKFSVYLSEITRQRARLERARDAVGVVSLFGGGGTSAALGPSATEVRVRLAAALGLRSTEIPWHVARDGIAEFGTTFASVSATCVRFAREVIDLSRTEIGEIAEPGGYHRGASSTMPQKANPIASEAIIGLGATAGALASALFRIMEAGHERAAGEWQIEWQVIPQIAVLASSAVLLTGQLCRQLVVNPAAIAANLLADGGLLMSEALMMQLAPSLGRETAHEVVYAAAHDSRAFGRPVGDVLAERLERDYPDVGWHRRTIEPSAYVGQAHIVCDAAVSAWRDFVDAV